MGRLKTEKVCLHGSERNEFQFSYEVYVNFDGSFTTMLPDNIVALFVAAGFKMGYNLQRKHGFFEASSLPELNKKVLDMCKDYMTKTLISDTVIIEYQISTACSYCLDPDKNIVPNGRHKFTKTENYKWYSGNSRLDTNNMGNYSLEVYVKPYFKKVYKFKSGKIKVEKELVDADDCENKPELEWLCSVVHMAPNSSSEVKEIEYTEAIARLFVNMIKSICTINEKIKDFTDPEQIKRIAESGQKFLG